jgi:hypothetical protein
MLRETQRYQKIYGCLLGGAIGDALLGYGYALYALPHTAHRHAHFEKG